MTGREGVIKVTDRDRDRDKDRDREESDGYMKGIIIESTVGTGRSI